MNLMKELDSKRILVSDGAWGTFLQAKGLQPGECPELWCITRPDDVSDIGRAYIEAGADMIETNSFGGNRITLKRYGLDDRAAGICEAAARLSREAAGPDHFVLGSIGPTGVMLITGDTTEEALSAAFEEQAAALAQGGCDAICIETMSALDEAAIAVRAAKKVTSLPVICTFTFSKTTNGEYRTMMGVTPLEAASGMIEVGADIIGTNCGNGAQGMVEICRLMHTAVPQAPILVHANAGLPLIENGKTVFPENPETMARQVESLIEAGVRVVGGCCGTTPAHIEAIAHAVRKVMSNAN